MSRVTYFIYVALLITLVIACSVTAEEDKGESGRLARTASDCLLLATGDTIILGAGGFGGMGGMGGMGGGPNIVSGSKKGDVIIIGPQW